jgi:hypothetical protein
MSQKVKVVGHVISIHDQNKTDLRDSIPTSIAIIDLDKIQKKVMISKNYRTAKNELDKAETTMKKFRQEGGNNYSKYKDKRSRLKHQLIDVWRSECQKEIENEVLRQDVEKVLYVGYDLYPSSFNDKIEINVPDCGKLILNTDGEIYCKQLVKQYLQRYRGKIIEGKFPLKYIDLNYLTKRHDRLTNHYLRLGYEQYDMETLIKKSLKETQKDVPITGKLYLTLPYDCGDEIVVDGTRKKGAYSTVEEALEHVKKYPIYLYEVDGKQFSRATENLEVSVNIPVIRKKMLMNKP